MEFLVLVQVPGLQKLEMYVYVELLLSQEDISPLLMWQWELSTKFFSSLKSNNYFKCYKFLEHVELGTLQMTAEPWMAFSLFPKNIFLD